MSVVGIAIIAAVVFAGLIVLGVVWVGAVSKLGRQDPEAVLATRYAKGEIDEKEYARRLAILRYGPPMELPD